MSAQNVPQFTARSLAAQWSAVTAEAEVYTRMALKPKPLGKIFLNMILFNPIRENTKRPKGLPSILLGFGCWSVMWQRLAAQSDVRAGLAVTRAWTTRVTSEDSGFRRKSTAGRRLKKDQTLLCILIDSL